MLFRTIFRYPDYEINEFGEVRRKDTKHIRKTHSFNGHKRVRLSHNGSSEYVARLVAETYISNPEGKTDVRHIDGNKSNNHISNLEWASHSDIQKDSYGMGIDAPGKDKSPKRIRIIETGDEFPSISSCARYLKGSPSGIRQCLNGQLSSYKGYHFEIF